MKKFVLVTLLSIALIVSVHAVQSFAQSATSNCAVVKVGNPTEPTPTCATGTQGWTGGTTNNSLVGQAVVDLARKMIGRPYIWASPQRKLGWAHYTPDSPPAGFDCSGLAGWSWYWASAGKINMHGQTSADYHSSTDKNGNRYYKFNDKSQLQPGDLIYYSASGIHHVTIFSGINNGKYMIVEANDNKVREVPVRSGYAGFLRPVIK